MTLVFGPGNPAPEQYHFTSAGRFARYNTAASQGSQITVLNSYDSKNRLVSHWDANGSGVNATYAYDARGNLVESRQMSMTPGTPADIVRTASYPQNCNNQKTCNKPTWTRDAKGNQTDYTYAGSTGQVTTITGPAPAAGGTRPKTTFTYNSFEAYYRDASGAIVPSGLPVSRLTRVSACMSTASCNGTADEARSTLNYGPQVSGTANNLLPVSTTRRTGDGSVVATTTFAYTGPGDVTTVDGPLPGTADVQRTYYDAMRQPTGAIGPDPDDGGTALFPAARITYNGEGQPAKREAGTATNQGDSGMTTFSPLSEANSTYNGQGRLATQSVTSGGTTYGLTQYGYMANGLLECVAQRMNPATYGALPTSACVPATQGSDGPDRIAQTAYDNRFRPTSVTTGVGSTAPAVESRTYDTLGRVSTQTDAENNTTTYIYDGMSRVYRVRFPDPAQGSGTSSTTDYEQFGYDPNGNVTSFRTRRAETLTLTYDDLNRLTVKNLPNRAGDWCGLGSAAACNTFERDVFFAYDLFGTMTLAAFDSLAGADKVENTFDALGRLMSSTLSMDGASRPISYLYDVAGNRTRVTHPDGTYIEYARHGSGALEQLALNGASPLVRPLLDTAGRLYRLERYRPAQGNWATRTTFGYDPVSRLSSLALNPAGTTYDSTTTLTWNPASQIASATRGNDLYAFPDYANDDSDYTADGLNRYADVAGASLAYDANGNLTSDGSESYIYDIENRMVVHTAGGATSTARYDPLGRLYEQTTPTYGVRWLYDGDAMVAEYDMAGAMLARWIHGTSAGDDPLAYFAGSSLADADRRYLYADERGSIVAVTNAAGTVATTGAYDEYGKPRAGFPVRFGYTGQMWTAFGLWHYKARMYSPTLGRFMQTDPIGYGDGMNMYAYVRNDPVNYVDPSGLQCAGIANADCSDESVITVTGQRPDTDLNYQGSPRGTTFNPATAAKAEARRNLPTPAAQQEACKSGIFAAALRRRDVQSAINDSIRIGNDKGTSIRAPVETAFSYGRTVSGGRGVTSVHTIGQPDRVEPMSWFAQMEDAGIYDAEIFFHYDPAGAPLSTEDMALVGPAIYFQGFSGVVTYGKDGRPYCYAN